MEEDGAHFEVHSDAFRRGFGKMASSTLPLNLGPTGVGVDLPPSLAMHFLLLR